jgi:uncharacterized protein YdaU (DUF1376 family)
LYRDLIELYYDTEQPLPADNFDRLCRLVLAHSEEEKSSLKSILDEFFVLTGSVYSHDYCDEQIEKFRKQTSAKALAGKASAASRQKRKADRKAKRVAPEKPNQTVAEQQLNSSPAVVANHEQRTKNHNTTTDVVVLAHQTPPETFRMHTGWKPEHLDINQMAIRAGVTMDPMNQAAIDDFVLYWSGRRESFSQTQWIGKYLKSAKVFQQKNLVADIRNKREVIEARGNDKNSMGFLERHTNKDWRNGL